MNGQRRESVWIYHVISAIVLVLSVAYTFSSGWNVTLRAWQAIKDVGNSCVYYASNLSEFMGLGSFGAGATVQEIPDSMTVFMPLSWAEMKEYFAGYWERFSSKKCFTGYMSWVGTTFLNCSKIVVVVLLAALPLFLALFLGLIFGDEDYGKKSVPLRVWLQIRERTIYPLSVGIKKWWRFLMDEDAQHFKLKVTVNKIERDAVAGKRYRILFIGIWLFNLNIATIGFEIIAWLLWVGFAMGFGNVFVQIAKLAVDLSVAFRVLPTVLTVCICCWVFHKFREHLGINRLKFLVEEDMDFLEEHPGNLLAVGKPRVGKTKSITLLGILENVRLRRRAEKKAMEDMKQFRHMNWRAVRKTVANFRKLPQFGLEFIRGFVDELQYHFENRENMSDKQRKEILKNYQNLGYVGKDFIFGYNHEEYGMTYNNGLILVPLWRALVYYMEEYAIYTSPTPLIIGNYPVRTTIRWKKQGENYPILKSNFFKLRAYDVERTTSWSHIVPYDGLRLGVKYKPDGKYNNSLDSGIFLFSELGKELGNQITNRGKDKAGGCNPTNDLMTMNAKMISHGLTINHETYTRVLADEQRSGSVQSDFNELGTKLTLKTRTKDKIQMPFFAFDEAAYLLYDGFYNKFWKFYHSRHGKETLLMYTIERIDNILHNHYLRVFNRFASHDIKLRVTDESSGETLDKSKDERIHMPKCLTDGDVYDTAYFGVVYREKFRRSQVGGREKIPQYTGKTPTIPQMVFQESHMVKEVFKHFDVNVDGEEIS